MSPLTGITPQTATATAPQRLRADFAEALEARLGQMKVEDLPDGQQKKLTELQQAAEGLESHFVKKILSQMRTGASFAEDAGPMGEYARDLMDQAIADQAAQSSGFGIAKSVFLDLAERLARTARPIDQGTTQE